MKFTYAQHSVEKPCVLKTRCLGVVHTTASGVTLPCQELVNGELKVAFDMADYHGGVIPGTYEYKYQVYVDGDESGGKCHNSDENAADKLPPHRDFSFELELKDPCSDAVNIQPRSRLGDIEYTVGDDMQRVSTSNLFTITPSICGYE